MTSNLGVKVSLLLGRVVKSTHGKDPVRVVVLGGNFRGVLMKLRVTPEAPGEKSVVVYLEKVVLWSVARWEDILSERVGVEGVSGLGVHERVIPVVAESVLILGDRAVLSVARDLLIENDPALIGGEISLSLVFYLAVKFEFTEQFPVDLILCVSISAGNLGGLSLTGFESGAPGRVLVVGFWRVVF